ncbi:hypothetical protein AB6J30_002692 [Salmonella enterica]
MNLSDYRYEDWMKIKAVALVLRDISDHYAYSVTGSIDKVLYDNGHFKISLYTSSIVIQKNVEDVLRERSFILGVNTEEGDDKRPYSARLHKESDRFTVRNSDSNSILYVDNNNWWFRDVRGDEVYLDVLESTDKESLELEVFQKSLIYTEPEMNAMIMNYLLRNTLISNESSKIYLGYTNTLHHILDAYQYLEDIQKECLKD